MKMAKKFELNSNQEVMRLIRRASRTGTRIDSNTIRYVDDGRILDVIINSEGSITTVIPRGG